jgi:hypothetical protein
VNKTYVRLPSASKNPAEEKSPETDNGKAAPAEGAIHTPPTGHPPEKKE